MDPDKNAFITFLNSTNFYFFKLKNLINEIKTYSFYSDDYKDLLSVLANFNSTKTEEFENFKSFLIGEINKEKTSVMGVYKKYYQKLNRYNDFLRFYNKIIKTFLNAENFYIHQGIFILLEEFIKKFSENSKFIIYPYFPKSKVNYGFANLTTDVLIKFFEEEEQQDIEDYLVFAIPAVNKEDILINCLLGHEIGHMIYRIKNLNIKFIPTIFAKDKIEKSYDSMQLEINKKKSLLGSDLPPKIKNFKLWQNVISKWVEEIICDKIGLRLFGLGYFFAFLDFVYISSPYTSGTERHPPNWLRLKILLEDFQEIFQFKTSFKIHKKDLRPEIEGIITFIKDNFSKEIEIKDDDRQFPEKEIEFSVIKKHVIDVINNSSIYHDLFNNVLDNYIKKYDFEFNFKDIKNLIDLIDLYITPNEIIDFKNHTVKKVDIITILNAAWIYLYFFMDNHYIKFPKLNEMDVRQKFNNLILKSIELAKIQRKVNEITRNKIILKIIEIFQSDSTREINRESLITELGNDKNFYKQLVLETFDDLLKHNIIIKGKNNLIKISKNFLSIMSTIKETIIRSIGLYHSKEIAEHKLIEIVSKEEDYDSHCIKLTLEDLIQKKILKRNDKKELLLLLR